MRSSYQSVMTPYCRGAAVTKADADTLGKSELALLAVGELPLLGAFLDCAEGRENRFGWRWK